MNIVDQATQFVALKYDGKRRTAMQIPYATHLFGVARILKNTGYRDTVVTAGLLHDILEDNLVTEHGLRVQFGEEVLLLVKATTEMPKSEAWHIRKQSVINSIQGKTPDELAILLAEKIQNMRSIIVELEQFGAGLWHNFNAPKEQQEWYYKSIIEQVETYHPNALLLPQLQQVVEKLFAKVAH
ncbi:MAG: HD domain-containing protein [Solibacillus sp.]